MSRSRSARVVDMADFDISLCRCLPSDLPPRTRSLRWATWILVRPAKEYVGRCRVINHSSGCWKSFVARQLWPHCKKGRSEFTLSPRRLPTFQFLLQSTHFVLSIANYFAFPSQLHTGERSNIHNLISTLSASSRLPFDSRCLPFDSIFASVQASCFPSLRGVADSIMMA
jgi:hypothetical protein